MINQFLRTVITKSGPIRNNVQHKRSITEVFQELISLHLQGSVGIDVIFDMANIKNVTALDPRKSHQHIEEFERRMEILQKLKLLKNVGDDHINTLSKWLFMSTEMSVPGIQNREKQQST